MSIYGYEMDSFGEKLNTVLSPSHPVNSVEHLHGREREMETIQRALYLTGTHIFIHGDRGVGKSSLGATAAFQYQSSDHVPVIVGGSVDDTFRTVIANVANQALARNRLESVKRQTGFSFEWRGIKWTDGQEISTRDIAGQIESISDAVELIKQVAERLGTKPVVVIDEFDALKNEDERNKFASLLKLLGDQQVNLKFIFTAVGSTLDKLLGAHQSAYRQLECIHLGRLGWDGRRAIVKDAVRAFEIDVDENVVWRIAAVSDGYPYYVHLITNKMLWAAFSSDQDVDKIGWEHYHGGLRDAIQAINAELRRPYDKAVSFREREFEDVVWSTADGEELFRGIPAMYLSYRRVQEQRPDGRLLDKQKYSEILRKLKMPAFGSVLQQLDGRAGWYTYQDAMLRGYVRMQAEANNVELYGDFHIPKQKMHMAINTRIGYRGPSVPFGIRLRDDE